MNWKEFFQPTKIKIVITNVLFFIPLLIQFFIFRMGDNQGYGFPLTFILRVTYQCGVGTPCPAPHYEFFIINMIFNVIMLYLSTILIIFIFRKSEIIKNKLIRPLPLTLFIFIISTIFSYTLDIYKIQIYIGLPLTFYKYGIFPLLGDLEVKSFFYLHYLIIDIIFWYIISIIILLIYYKFLKK